MMRGSVGAGRLGKCRPDGLERAERLEPLWSA